MIIEIKGPVTSGKLEKALAKIKTKRKKKRGLDVSKVSGKLKGVFGDPVEYQKKVRSEWD